MLRRARFCLGRSRIKSIFLLFEDRKIFNLGDVGFLWLN